MQLISQFFGKLLFMLYNFSGNYAVSIILFTIITKVILLPFTIAQKKSASQMKNVQPLISKINERYKSNPQKQSEMLQSIYHKYNISPMAGCLPLLIQLPIIVALFRTMREPVKYVFGTKESYKLADTGMLWLESMSQPDVIKVFSISIPFILPILTALFQFLQMKFMMKDQGTDSGAGAGVQKSMMYVFPVMMLFWGITFPSGLMLYWFTGTLVQMVQEKAIEKFIPTMSEDIKTQIEEDLENLSKPEKKTKKTRKSTTAKEKSQDFYDKYQPSKNKVVKRVRKIPKKNIIVDDDIEENN